MRLMLANDGHEKEVEMKILAPFWYKVLNCDVPPLITFLDFDDIQEEEVDSIAVSLFVGVLVGFDKQ